MWLSVDFINAVYDIIFVMLSYVRAYLTVGSICANNASKLMTTRSHSFHRVA